MAKVKVYLLTYRRHNLLPRALESLINQTFEDWVCELHNDDPNDQVPAEIAGKYADPRITVCTHSTNLGPTRTFNLVFEEAYERYVSILEDDNWWNEDFLAKMVTEMEFNPSLEVIWSNMRIWKEASNGKWIKTDNLIWDIEDRIRVFSHYSIDQLHHTYHSNGAMLVRSGNLRKYIIPDSTSTDMMEALRERCYKYPIALLNEELANFALTEATSRVNTTLNWNVCQVILSGSILASIDLNRDHIRYFWESISKLRSKTSHHYFIAALFYPRILKLLLKAPINHFLFGILYNLKHLNSAFKVYKTVKNKKDLRGFCDLISKEKSKDLFLNYENS